MPVAPRPVCILSVGRSGTSLAARVVNVLGVDLGPEDTMMAPSELNPKGFWEQLEIMELNDAVLAALGGTWWQPPDRPEGWERRREFDDFRDRIRALVARDFSKSRRWGFKDPRTALTLPLWRSVVGEFDYIVCVRHPLEVRASLADGMPQVLDTLALWVRYQSEILRLTEGRRRVFVFYDEWFEDPGDVAERLGGFLGAGAPLDAGAHARVVDVLDAGLRRQRADDDAVTVRTDVPVDAAVMYLLLRDLAEAEREGHADRARCLQAIGARLDDDVVALARAAAGTREARAYIGQLEAHRDALLVDRERLRGTLAELQAAHDAAAAERERVRAEAQAWQSALATTYGSRSWRLTAPLRAARRRLR